MLTFFLLSAPFYSFFYSGGFGGNAQAPPDDPLGSQESIVLSSNGQCLFAVNAGSDTISAFRVNDDSLDLVDDYDTFGSFPVSIAIHNKFVYVLNAGDEGSIAGYRLVNTKQCRLIPIRKSSRGLLQDGDNPPFFVVSPSQISFTPDGRFLVVVVKGAVKGEIFVFPIGNNGRPSSPIITTAEGPTPFSFDFDPDGNLLLSEAFGTAEGPPPLVGITNGAGAVSSYEITSNGSLNTISASVGNDQSATCWLKYVDGCAFVTNNFDDTISSYEVGDDGSLDLVDSVAASDINAPIDITIVDHFMYVLSTRHTLDDGNSNQGQPAIYVYEVNTRRCSLSLIEVIEEGLPDEDTTVNGVVGLVAI